MATSDINTRASFAATANANSGGGVMSGVVQSRMSFSAALRLSNPGGETKWFCGWLAGGGGGDLVATSSLSLYPSFFCLNRCAAFLAIFQGFVTGAHFDIFRFGVGDSFSVHNSIASSSAIPVCFFIVGIDCIFFSFFFFFFLFFFYFFYFFIFDLLFFCVIDGK
jgi:hypothetical protein